MLRGGGAEAEADFDGTPCCEIGEVVEIVRVGKKLFGVRDACCGCEYGSAVAMG